MNIGERISGYIREKTEAMSAQGERDALVANTVLGIFQDINSDLLDSSGKITQGLLIQKTIVLEWGEEINPQTLAVECNRLEYAQKLGSERRYCVGVPSDREKFVIDLNDPGWKEKLETGLSGLVGSDMCRFQGPIPL